MYVYELIKTLFYFCDQHTCYLYLGEETVLWLSRVFCTLWGYRTCNYSHPPPTSKNLGGAEILSQDVEGWENDQDPDVNKFILRID